MAMIGKPLRRHTVIPLRHPVPEKREPAAPAAPERPATSPASTPPQPVEKQPA